MENKLQVKSHDKLIKLLKALFCSYLLTGILLLLLAFLLYQFRLKERQIDIGIIVIYVLSTFVGGFLSGKWMKVRKFLWGMLTGMLYFLLLFVVSFAVYKTIQQNGISLLTTFALCVGGGMIGGMIS